MPEPLHKQEERESGSVAGETNLLEILIVVAKRKYFILTFVGTVAVLSVIVSLVLPKMYTAKATIMPPVQDQSMNISSLLGQLGPLGALAGSESGVMWNSSELYVSVIKSRVVADALIDRFSLMSVYNAKYRVDARKNLADRSDIMAGKDGVISISVDDRDPKRAAALANAYVEELEKLTKTLAVTEAGRRRLFFEREMKKARDELAASEQALKETQEKTGLIFLDSQSKAMIEMVSSLRAQVAAREVEIQVMRTFATSENPNLIMAKQQLAALQAQVAKLENGPRGKGIGDVSLENVPTAGLEYARKLRDVKYDEELFELLSKQYEIARIDEGRDSAIVQELDRALPPERKSWPIRSLLVVVTTCGALFIAIVGAWFKEQADDDPRFTTQLQLLKFHLRQKS